MDLNGCDSCVYVRFNESTNKTSKFSIVYAHAEQSDTKLSTYYYRKASIPFRVALQPIDHLYIFNIHIDTFTKEDETTELNSCVVCWFLFGGWKTAFGSIYYESPSKTANYCG